MKKSVVISYGCFGNQNILRLGRRGNKFYLCGVCVVIFDAPWLSFFWGFFLLEILHDEGQKGKRHLCASWRGYGVRKEQRLQKAGTTHNQLRQNRGVYSLVDGLRFTWILVLKLCHQKCMSLPSAWTSLVAQLIKNPPAVRETWVRSLGWEDPLEKRRATPSSILAWRTPWTV